MVMNTTKFNRTSIDISKNIKILAAMAFKLHQKEWKTVIGKEGTDLKIDKQMTYEGPGAAPIKPEGNTGQSTEVLEGNIESAVQDSHVYELPVTWEQRKFAVGNPRFMNMVGQYLSRSMVLSYEYKAANVLNNGFTAAQFAGGDGKALYANDHTFKTGDVYSNLLTAAALSKTSLESALQTIANAKMENNIPAALKASQVIIAYTNIFVLPELLKSNLDPDTANNTYNAITDFNLTKNLNHYITSSDDWFVDTDKNARTLKEAQATMIDSYTNDETNNLVMRGWASIATMIHDMLGTYGNQGS